MEKFSKISGVKVDSNPIPIKKTNESELDSIKIAIHQLMDQLLKIESYGSLRPQWIIPMKIGGKEMFIEALIDLFNEIEGPKQIKILESLKQTNKDWKSIDEKIFDITNQPTFNQKERNTVEKYKSILEKYSGDQLEMFLKSQVDKIKNPESIISRIKILEKLSNDQKFSHLNKDDLKIIKSILQEKYRSMNNE